MFVKPGPEGKGIEIYLPDADYDRVYPGEETDGDAWYNAGAIVLTVALGEDISPDDLLVNFAVDPEKLSPEVREAIENSSGHIAIPMGDRSLADVLEGVTGNLAEIFEVTEADLDDET